MDNRNLFSGKKPKAFPSLSPLQCFTWRIKVSRQPLTERDDAAAWAPRFKAKPQTLSLSSSHLHVPGGGRQQRTFDSPRKLQRAVPSPGSPLQVLPRNRYRSLRLLRNAACLSSSIFLLESHRGEALVVPLSPGCLQSPSPAACSWFSLSNDFGFAAVVITQLGSGKARPVADACLIAAGCVRRLEDLL